MTVWWLQDGGATAGWALFFALAIGHALGDYPLQSDFLAKHKNRHFAHAYTDLPPARTLWLHCLTAHALIHAGIVWLLTGRAALGAAELVLHWLIDWLKIERKINFHVDQLLHLLCKVGFVWWLCR